MTARAAAIRTGCAAYLSMLAASAIAGEDPGEHTDLLASGEAAWVEFDRRRWRMSDGVLEGRTAVLDGDKTDPAASTFLVSRRIFGGDVLVSMDITFEAGRYAGVYIDFDQRTQSGIWMATGHALPDDDRHHVESGYIKSVVGGHWIVRATGELPIERRVRTRLRFERRADDYNLWHDDRLVATWRKPGGYDAGPLQLRLTNAHARIERLEVTSDRLE